MRRIVSPRAFLPIRLLPCAVIVAGLAMSTDTAWAADDVPPDVLTADPTEQAEAGRGPGRAGIQIEHLVALGNGCPEGSFRGYLSDAGQQFHLRFVGFVPEITPRQSSVRGRCRLTIYVRVPAGLQYELQRFAYVGYAALERGVSAEVAARYFFNDDGSRADEIRTTFKGPFDDTFTIEDVTTSEGIWSPCGGREAQILNVELEVLLRNGSPAGYGIVDIEESLGMTFRYRTCQ